MVICSAVWLVVNCHLDRGLNLCGQRLFHAASKWASPAFLIKICQGLATQQLSEQLARNLRLASADWALDGEHLAGRTAV